MAGAKQVNRYGWGSVLGFYDVVPSWPYSKTQTSIIPSTILVFNRALVQVCSTVNKDPVHFEVGLKVLSVVDCPFRDAAAYYYQATTSFLTGC